MSENPEAPTLVANPNPSKENAVLNKQITTIKYLAVFEIILSILCFIVGIAEAALVESAGPGIWCSICPFIAGILGTIVGSKTATDNQIQKHLVFSVLGSIMMVIMVIIESASMASGNFYRYNYGNDRAVSLMKILLCCVGSVNAILLTFSASLICCRCQKPRSNDAVYVAYHPLQTPQSGMTANPQMVAMAPNPQMMTMAPNSQMVTMAPNSQMMTMAPNPQMMIMNGAQMQQYGFGQQGYPIMFAQPQIQQVVPQQFQQVAPQQFQQVVPQQNQQVAPQQFQPSSYTQPEPPEYQEPETVPQTNDS